MKIFNATLYFQRITEITIEALKQNDIECLLLDVDNTLSTHHGTVLVDGLAEWLQNMRQNGIKLVVVSNSKFKRIKPFADKIGLDFVSLALKPLPFGYKKGIKKLGCDKQNVAIVGDQLFTDIIGANALKIKSILVRPVKLESGWSFKIRRYFEKKILKERF